MNPESCRFKKILYLDTLIKINAFFREAAAEFLCGVNFYELLYFAADFFGEGNSSFANSDGLFAARPDEESAGQRAQFEAGLMEVRYIYRAFGEELKRPGEGNAKYTYGGKELDGNTNLYYFNARYYDATTGRFINVEPVQDGTNWYVYCNNNPLCFKDPTGLEDKELVLKKVTTGIATYRLNNEQLSNFLIDVRKTKSKEDWSFALFSLTFSRAGEAMGLFLDGIGLWSQADHGVSIYNKSDELEKYDVSNSLSVLVIDNFKIQTMRNAKGFYDTVIFHDLTFVIYDSNNEIRLQDKDIKAFEMESYAHDNADIDFVNNSWKMNELDFGTRWNDFSYIEDLTNNSTNFTKDIREVKVEKCNIWN